MKRIACLIAVLVALATPVAAGASSTGGTPPANCTRSWAVQTIGPRGVRVVSGLSFGAAERLAVTLSQNGWTARVRPVCS